MTGTALVKLTTNRRLLPAILVVVVAMARIGTNSCYANEDGIVRSFSSSSFSRSVHGRMLQAGDDALTDDGGGFFDNQQQQVIATPVPTMSPAPSFINSTAPSFAPSQIPSSIPTIADTTLAPSEAITDEVTDVVAEDTPSPTPVPTPVPTSVPEPFFDDNIEETPSPTRTPRTRSPSLAPFQFNDNTAQEKTNTIPQSMIIGISAGAGACVLLLAAILLLYSNNKKKSNMDQDTAPSNGKSFCDPSYTKASPQIFVPAYGGDEVSTLGDPAGLYGGASRKNMFEDDALSLNTNSMNKMLENGGGGINSERNIYGDDGQSLNTKSMSRILDSATQGIDPESLRSDPGECFDVRLPAGKAGIILEDGPRGYPIVHSIKPGSPLFNFVKRGDRLCSIEGIDCAGMSPHIVARKLQANEKQSSRILTFSRSTM